MRGKGIATGTAIIITIVITVGFTALVINYLASATLYARDKFKRYKKKGLMMQQKEILEKLSKAVIDANEEATMKAAKDAIAAGIDPIKAINEGLVKGMEVMGKKFEKFEAFIPEILNSVDAMRAGLNILKPKIMAGKETEIRHGVVVIGTCHGDIHDIGKNLVATMLEVAGFEVHNIGSDVKVLDFIRKANEVKADIIAMSSLLTASMPYQGDVIKDLEDKGRRGKYFIIIGGGATMPEWAENIRADGWGKSALDAVEVCKLLMDEKPSKPLKKPISILGGGW